MHAISRGDLSGNVIHPSLVHLAQMWGCVFWQQHHTISVNDEMTQLRFALNCLIDTSRRQPSPMEMLQAYTLLFMYAYFRRDVIHGDYYLRCASKTARLNNLHIIVPSQAPISEISEECEAVCSLLFTLSTPYSPLKNTTRLYRRLSTELSILLVTICAIYSLCNTILTCDLLSRNNILHSYGTTFVSYERRLTFYLKKLVILLVIGIPQRVSFIACY